MRPRLLELPVAALFLVVGALADVVTATFSRLGGPAALASALIALSGTPRDQIRAPTSSRPQASTCSTSSRSRPNARSCTTHPRLERCLAQLEEIERGLNTSR